MCCEARLNLYSKIKFVPLRKELSLSWHSPASFDSWRLITKHYGGDENIKNPTQYGRLSNVH